RAATSRATTDARSWAWTRCSSRSRSGATWTRPASPGTRPGPRPCNRSCASCWRPPWPTERSDLERRQVALFLEPGLAVGRALLRQQHVHQGARLVGVVHGQLHQAAGVGVDGRLAQLRRVHLAQALEAGHVDLALELLARDLLQQQALLFLVERVEDLL